MWQGRAQALGSQVAAAEVLLNPTAQSPQSPRVGFGLRLADPTSHSALSLSKAIIHPHLGKGGEPTYSMGLT